jgi:predicted regulator of Ras-like GTPase activity (Roadblock/LC7/MglB family)
VVDHAAPAEPRRSASGVAAGAPTSRARAFREVLADLGRLAGVRGGLIVTADGLMVTADLPPRVPAEALAALAATLGRQLELSMAQLDRGAFRTAVFSADDGSVFVGGSPIGFLILLADATATPAAVTPALRKSLSRLEAAWRAS